MTILKNMKTISLIIIAAALVISSCSPVRTKGSRTTKATPRVEKPGNNNAAERSSAEPVDASAYGGRFRDTTVVVVSGGTSSQVSSSLEEQFDDAVRFFDNENYGAACDKFNQFAQTIAQGDSLYYEAVFYSSECSLIRGDMNAGKQLLNGLLAEKTLPDICLQKTLVRLGQIYCMEDNKIKASQYFNRLKREFPNSVYNKIANCEFVGK